MCFIYFKICQSATEHSLPTRWSGLDIRLYVQECWVLCPDDLYWFLFYNAARAFTFLHYITTTKKNLCFIYFKISKNSCLIIPCAVGSDTVKWTHRLRVRFSMISFFLFDCGFFLFCLKIICFCLIAIILNNITDMELPYDRKWYGYSIFIIWSFHMIIKIRQKCRWKRK